MADQLAVQQLLAGKEAWSIYETSDSRYDLSGADLSALQTLREYRFLKQPDFSGCKFGQLFIDGTAFHNGADFKNIKVSEAASIRLGSFVDKVLDFSGATFLSTVDVLGGQTHKGAPSGGAETIDLSRSKVGDRLSLHGCFRSYVVIDECEVEGPIYAVGAKFAKGISASKLKITSSERPENWLDFSYGEFSLLADFSNMVLPGGADFSGSKFRGPTIFRGARFAVAPKFHGAELHQETAFNPIEEFDLQFPDVLTEDSEACYRTLKFQMIGHHALEEQLGFGRLELKARARRRRWWRLSIFHAYELLSDYGLSAVRPFVGLLMLTILSWLGLWCFAAPYTGVFDHSVASLALSNVLPFVSTLKVVSADQAQSLFPGIRIFGFYLVSICQGVLSAVLIFLMALGIRNRLRLR